MTILVTGANGGVGRLVVDELSSGAVTAGYDTDFHLPVERAVEASGVEWTHVRPGEFMLNKLALWGPSIRAERIVRDPYPDVEWCPVHEQDIADVALTALLDDGHGGAAYDVNGPAPISHRDQVGAIAAALGEEVALSQVSREEAREIYRKLGGFAAASADFLLGFADYSGDSITEGDSSDLSSLGPLPTATKITGRPARTFAQWAVDHADDFR